MILRILQLLKKAETEFEKYRIVQDRLYKSDFDLFLEELENKLEANKHGKEYWWKSENRGPIKAVGSKSLSEAGINFFSTLSYDTSLQARKLGVPVLES